MLHNLKSLIALASLAAALLIVASSARATPAIPFHPSVKSSNELSLTLVRGGRGGRGGGGRFGHGGGGRFGHGGIGRPGHGGIGRPGYGGIGRPGYGGIGVGHRGIRVGHGYRGGVWYGTGRRYWGGRWYAYGVGTCWRWTDIGYVWICR